MYISDDNERKYSVQVDIYETLDAPEDTINSEDLYNQITEQLEDEQYYGYSKEEEQDMEETFPPESQGDQQFIIKYM